MTDSHATKDDELRGGLGSLAGLARALRATRDLEALLQLCVDHGAALLDTPRVSVRLLGEGDALLVHCRHGEAMHGGGGARFRRGEGLVGQVAEGGETLRTGDAESHPNFVARPAQVTPLGSFLGVPLFDREGVIGVLAAVAPERDRFGPDDEAALEVVAAICAPRIAVARLERIARIDALTSVLNRRGLRQTLREHEGAGDAMSVVLVDIDHFKQVNDRFGHAIGDEVLVQVAAALEGCLRGGDSVARYGGEEFLLTLPHVGAGTAVAVAERARAAIESLWPRANGTAIRVTISAGVAERGAGEASEATIARADQALYAAKNAGRNCVEVAAAAPAPPKR